MKEQEVLEDSAQDARLQGLYSIITSQSFYDMYNGIVNDHITGEEGCLTREEIMAELADEFYHVIS